MTEFFGGFSRSFYEAYGGASRSTGLSNAQRPLQPLPRPEPPQSVGGGYLHQAVRMIEALASKVR
jgi:hypothetical protein